MWPVWLIVIVAAIASGVLLVVGVVLAITFERRRYRRYVERHTAGTSIVTDKEASTVFESGGDITHCQSSFQRLVLNSPTTWITLPSPSRRESDRSMIPTSRESTKSDLARKKGLHKTLRSTISKRRSQRRCLQKKMTCRNHVTSPLSVITEVTDCTQISPAPRSESSASIPKLLADAEKEKEACRWPFEKLEDHSSAAQDIDDTASKKCSPIRSQAYHGSEDGLKSVSPISQLMHSLLEDADDKNGHTGALPTSTSTSTIESASSSVLRLTPTGHCQVSHLAEKTRSQALNDFEFDLNPTMQLKSPKHVTSLPRHTQRAVATKALKASVNHGTRPSRLPRLKVKQGKWPVNAELIAARATSLSLAPSGRYSMIENVEVLSHRPSYNLNQPELGPDPFVTEIRSRPASVESWMPLQDWRYKISTQHSPPHCGAPTTRTMQWYRYSKPAAEKLRNTSMAHNSTVYARMREDGPVTQIDALKEMQDMKARGSPASIKQKSIRMQYLHHGQLKGSSPATPDSNNSSSNYDWKFDFVLGSSPKPSTTSSPLRSYDSPVLPPPAYTQASLYPRPLQPRVMGPRSPRRAQPQSPLNPNMKHHRIPIYGAVKSNSKKRNVSPDLLRSIQMLRSMNSDCQLPKLNTGLGRRFTSGNESNHDSNNSKERSEIRKLFRDPSLASNNPSLPRLSPPPGTSRIPLQRRQSSSSVGGISVWEDASVYDDSPKPEVPRDISFASNNSPVVKMPFVTGLEPKTSCSDRTSIISEHDHENNVQAEVIMEHKVGLGLKFVEIAVPDTPRSMYDEKGFLRV